MTTLRLRDRASIDALLGSPVRLELVDALQALGRPAGVRELAAACGRKPSALYHHLRKLEGAGIVVRAGTRKSGPRDEALYAPAARRVSVDDAPRDARAAEALRRGAAAVLRMAERDFARALQASARKRPPAHRALSTTREKAWLTARDLDELHRRLEDLRGFLRERSRPGRGRLIALTLSAADVGRPSERGRR